jgi:hypothetical protein
VANSSQAWSWYRAVSTKTPSKSKMTALIEEDRGEELGWDMGRLGMAAEIKKITMETQCNLYICNNVAFINGAFRLGFTNRSIP